MSEHARVKNTESGEETKSEIRYLDDECETATVVVVADGCVAPGNNLAVNFSRDGDVLANGKPENVLRMGKLETITAERGCQRSAVQIEGVAYMAVLGETWIFSWRGNSFHAAGSSGLARPEMK